MQNRGDACTENKNMGHGTGPPGWRMHGEVEIPHQRDLKPSVQSTTQEKATKHRVFRDAKMLNFENMPLSRMIIAQAPVVRWLLSSQVALGYGTWLAAWESSDNMHLWSNHSLLGDELCSLAHKARVLIPGSFNDLDIRRI
jgi:hypothetical protein